MSGHHWTITVCFSSIGVMYEHDPPASKHVDQVHFILIYIMNSIPMIFPFSLVIIIFQCELDHPCFRGTVRHHETLELTSIDIA